MLSNKLKKYLDSFQVVVERATLMVKWKTEQVTDYTKPSAAEPYTTTVNV